MEGQKIEKKTDWESYNWRSFLKQYLKFLFINKVVYPLKLKLYLIFNHLLQYLCASSGTCSGLRTKNKINFKINFQQKILTLKPVK